MTGTRADASPADAASRSGSSFYLAMRLMPPAKRAAMYAVYAFCRAVDDVADGPARPDAKLAELETWRAEIGRVFHGRPEHPVGRTLVGPARRFGLHEADFLAVIDGVAMDAAGPIVAPSRAELERYIDGVACAVGRLSVRVFGCPEQEGLALARALGRALQLTNILRDLGEDAGQGRLYLPHEALAAHGIAVAEPGAVLSHPETPAVCRELATDARLAFAEADAVMARCPRRCVRPAAVMAAVYRALLDRLAARGWTGHDRPVRVPNLVKAWLALRHGVF